MTITEQEYCDVANGYVAQIDISNRKIKELQEALKISRELNDLKDQSIFDLQNELRILKEQS